jgi:hypothetical protein
MKRWISMVSLVGVAACGSVGSDAEDAGVDAPPETDGGADAAPDAAPAPRCRHQDAFTAFAPVGGVNTAGGEQNAWLAHDEKTIVFSREVTGKRGELFVGTRDDVADPFSVVHAIDELNSADDEYRAFLDDAGKVIYFDRQDDGLNYHVLTAERVTPAAEFGLAAPVDGVNSFPSTFEPVLTPEGLYVGIAKDTVGYVPDLALARRVGAGFASPEPLDMVNTVAGYEELPVPSKDGLALYFSARAREPGDTTLDVWRASRQTTDEPFAQPVRVESVSSPTDAEFPSWISDDNCRLYYTLQQEGARDLWVASRTPQ